MPQMDVATQFRSDNNHSKRRKPSPNINKDYLIVKSIYKLRNGDAWLGYSTIEEDDQPMKLLPTYNRFYVDEVESDKKLILDGVVSLFEDDPFINDDAAAFRCKLRVVSFLLKYVHSCSISDLLLNHQKLSLEEYEMLVSTEMVQNLWFTNVLIKDDDNAVVPLEKLMEKLPNIEKIK